MPVVKIELWPGRPKETKQKLADKITADLVEILNVPKDACTIIIEEVPKENWQVGGKFFA